MFEELKPHIIELRKRLVICVVALLVVFIATFSFWKEILDFVLMPLKEVLPEQSNVVFTQLAEAFFTAIKVSFFASLLISAPIIFLQFWLFVAPGLYDNEKKIRLAVCFFCFNNVFFRCCILLFFCNSGRI